jgi:cobalt-zinc-cadmium efflux system outer membrane protein
MTPFTGVLFCQTDTLHITMAEAEQIFMRNNLQMLAAQYNVDASRAAVMQSGLWTNPTLSVEQNVYNQLTKRWFDTGDRGNSGIQITQLLVLAGKRDKLSRLAGINTRVAEGTLYDVMRSLKLELRSDMYNLHFLRQSLGFFDESIRMLGTTVRLMEKVYDRRAILLSEVLRVKALLFSLENDRLSLAGRIAETESSLRVLLRDTSAVQRAFAPALDVTRLESLRVDSLRLADAVATAFEHRPDLVKAEASVSFEEVNLELQKALAIPDLTVGGLWSRAGSYIPNYYALTLSIDLPLFNRNQGNIEMSERALQADKLLRDASRLRVEEEVANALRKVLLTDQLFKSFDRNFPLEYRQLVEGMIMNYQKRNMSVLEFTDFIESYRQSLLQMNQLANDRANAFELLNYAAGTDLLTP